MIHTLGNTAEITSHSSDKDWSPSPERSTYRQPPVMEIGIKCQNQPPVRLKSASVHPQAHIGIKCQEKPPVRLKWMLTRPSSSDNIFWDTVSGVRPEEEPQGSIWFLTHAILLSQHIRVLDLSNQRDDLCPVRSKRDSMCYRPAHRKEIGIGCADKPPVRLKSSGSTGWIESRSS